MICLYGTISCNLYATITHTVVGLEVDLRSVDDHIKLFCQVFSLSFLFVNFFLEFCYFKRKLSHHLLRRRLHFLDSFQLSNAKLNISMKGVDIVSELLNLTLVLFLCNFKHLFEVFLVLFI